MILNKEDIKKLIPHRDPFLFIDWCEIIKLGEEGKGGKIYLPEEYFFKGHFPKNPIVPGVVLIEALAQTAGTVVSHYLAEKNKDFNKNNNYDVFFMSVNNAKFRKPVIPNDEIIFEVKLLNRVKSVFKFYGEAKRGTDKVCESIYSAMIIDNK